MSLVVKRYAAPFLQRLTAGLPLHAAAHVPRIGALATSNSVGLFASEALEPGDVLFVERAFATLPEPRHATAGTPFCVHSFAPRHRVTVNAEQAAQISDDERIKLVYAMSQHLQMPAPFDLMTPECVACDELVSAACAETHVRFHAAEAPFVGDALHELTQLHFDDADADAERALLALRLFQQVHFAHGGLKSSVPALTLGPRLENMCYDEDLLADAAPLLQHTVGKRSDRVNALLDTILAQARAERYRSTYARLASVVRLNAFRVAATTLELQVTPEALGERQRVWPPAPDAVNAVPRDSVKFVGLFALGCYFNHSCDGNVALMSTTVPGAGFESGASSVRGDEFAFVALREIERGEELFLEYTSPEDHASFEQRHKHLESRYGFQCRCIRCVNQLS
jgi:hypothetical protein